MECRGPSTHPEKRKVKFIMRKTLAVLSVLFLAVVFGTARASDDAFPHRAKFKHVPIMSPETLRKDLDNLVLVDVRSRYDFETLHVKGALHIVLSKAKLPAAARELRAKSPKPIVFYCNGNSCKKSNTIGLGDFADRKSTRLNSS